MGWEVARRCRLGRDLAFGVLGGEAARGVSRPMKEEELAVIPFGDGATCARF